MHSVQRFGQGSSSLVRHLSGGHPGNLLQMGFLQGHEPRNAIVLVLCNQVLCTV